MLASSAEITRADLQACLYMGDSACHCRDDTAHEAARGVRIFQRQLDGIADYWICDGSW